MTPARGALAAALAVPALLAAAAPAARAAPGPPGIPVADMGPFTSAARATFAWGPAAPEEGRVILRYAGGLDPAEDDLGNADARSATVALGAEGRYRFRVWAVGDDGAGGEVAGPAASAEIVVDRTPPTIGWAFRDAEGEGGWYRRLTIDWTCADDAPGVVASCPADERVTGQGGPQRREGTAVDRAGNRATTRTDEFRLDSAAPRAGRPSGPGPGARVAAEPEFAWTAGSDETSGVRRYEVQYRAAGRGTWIPIATVSHAGDRRAYSARRSPVVAPLPERTQLEWRVVTRDHAGNSSASSARRLTIDSTVPPAPSIVDGPSGPTNAGAPRFAWAGEAGTYRWDVTPAGSDQALQAGEGPATEVTLGPLPDGDYAFRVVQVSPSGVESAEASRAFEVDTVAPEPPRVTVRPPFPTADPMPAFAWEAEPGARVAWEVIGPRGGVVQGPAGTTAAGVRLGPFPDGAYSLRLVQTDPAGNASAPVAEPFAIVGAGAPGPAAGAAPGPGAAPAPATRRRAFPALNARRLRPARGRVVSGLRPVLRWPAGARRARFYNVQLFLTTADGRARKVRSAFPRAPRWRVPKGVLRRGSCYVWRVWAHLGTRFAKRPLGISHFCVARRPARPRAR